LCFFWKNLKKKNLSPPEFKKKSVPQLTRNFPENEKKYKRNKEKNKKRAPNIRAKTIYHGVNTVATICARFRKKSARAFVLFAKARSQDHNLTEDKKNKKKHGRE